MRALLLSLLLVFGRLMIAWSRCVCTHNKQHSKFQKRIIHYNFNSLFFSFIPSLLFLMCSNLIHLIILFNRTPPLLLLPLIFFIVILYFTGFSRIITAVTCWRFYVVFTSFFSTLWLVYPVLKFSFFGNKIRRKKLFICSIQHKINY